MFFDRGAGLKSFSAYQEVFHCFFEWTEKIRNLQKIRRKCQQSTNLAG